MYPRKFYFKIVTSTILIPLQSGIVFSRITPVRANPDWQNQHEEIAQTSPQNHNQSQQVKRLNQDAIALLQQSRYQEALQRLEKALTITRQNGKFFWEAVTLNNIGRLYQNQGQYSQALTSFEEALVINRKLGDQVQLGKTYSNIGYLFDIQNQPNLAIFFYKHCLINREKARLTPALLTAEQPDAYTITVAETYRILGEKLLKQGRVSEAQRTIDLLKVEELEGYLEGVPGNQLTAKGIELSPPEKVIKQKIDQTFEGAIALGEELIKLRTITPEMRSQKQQQRISELVQAQQQILAEFNDFISSPAVKVQLEELNRTARRQNLDLENVNQIRDNLAQLPQKAVLLYPLILKDSLELVVVTPDSPPIRRTVAVNKDKLDQTILTFRQALQNPSLNINKPARQLYDWLIKPIENDLKQVDAKTILYAPDRQLRYIPLAALSDGKQWLVQRFNINHITAASLTNFNTPPLPELRILAAAFSKGSYQVKVANRQLTFSGLPFAAKEVENLATVIPGTKKILNDDFSPKVTVPQMDDYTIVHLATHAAFVVGKPEDSFILFGNGDRATLKDIATWSLPRVDLVVLSACETGLGGELGNGEEILGFGYQMQKTGAKSTIASLWVVDDGGTQALMSAFYALLSSGKFTKAEALRQAQISLVTGNLPALPQQQDRTNNIVAKPGDNFNHPYYWAAFILIGNGL